MKAKTASGFLEKASGRKNRKGEGRAGGRTKRVGANGGEKVAFRTWIAKLLLFRSNGLGSKKKQMG